MASLLRREDLVKKVQSLLNVLPALYPYLSITKHAELSELSRRRLVEVYSLAQALVDLAPFIGSVLPRYSPVMSLRVTQFMRPELSIEASVGGLGSLDIEVAPMEEIGSAESHIVLTLSSDVLEQLRSTIARELRGRETPSLSSKLVLEISGILPESIELRIPGTSHPASPVVKREVLRLVREHAGDLLDLVIRLVEKISEYLKTLRELY